MESIRDRVRGFLARSTSTDEKEIQDFENEILKDNPSLDPEVFNKRLFKVLEQRDEIREFENKLNSIGKESPFFKKLDKALNEAREGQENLEDVSKELKTVKKIINSFNGENKKDEREKVDKRELKTTEISSSEPKEEKKPIEKTKKSEKKTKNEKTKIQDNVTEKKIKAPETTVIVESPVEKTTIKDISGTEGKISEAQKDFEVNPSGQLEEDIHEAPQDQNAEEPGSIEVTSKTSSTEGTADVLEISENTIASQEDTPESSLPETSTGIPERSEIQTPKDEIPSTHTEKIPDQPESSNVQIPDQEITLNKETAEGDQNKSRQLEEDISEAITGPPDLKKDNKEEIKTEDVPKKGKKRKKKKEEVEIPVLEKQSSIESPDAMMRHLEDIDTRTLLKDQLTPERLAVFEILEDKLMSDVESRIKKLKDMQTKLLEEKPPETLLGKIKTFFTKEIDALEAYDPMQHGPLVTFEGMEGFNEIERYWVNEPYAFVVILFNPGDNSHLYYVAEPYLSEFEDLFLKEIKDRLKDVLLVEDAKLETDKDIILTNKVRQLIKDYAIHITPLTLEKVLYYTRRDFIKFGKIDSLMHDNRIEDVSANGHDIPIYLYHKKYTNIPTNIYFNEKELDSYVIRLAQRCGKHISIAEPMVDATMPDGSRIQMTLGKSVTSRGATFTIRKFNEIPITPVDLINWHTFSAEELAYLWLCIENNKSLIFAGGTASGKTSSLNAVSLFIPAQAKIVSLEDTRELKLPHPNWIPGTTRDSFTADGKGGIDMYELLRAALRQRPEYLLVGEVRGKEALTLFQAMSTGHTTFSTMHADSVSSAIHRLENPPISVPRTMIQALNIISIQAQTYVQGKRARRNMKLVEITDIDPTTKNIRTNDIFVWDPLSDKFIRTGESKALNEVMIRRGWNLTEARKEIANRQKILEFMVNNKISDFHAISTIIHDFQATPEKILTKLNISENG